MQAGTTGELSFDCVTVRFPDGTVALDGFSLHLGHGEFVSVVGPSGCGKSTLLRVAAGLQETDAGSTEVDRSGIGYVFQDPTLLPWRNVRANVELPAELHGVAAAERSLRAQKAIDLVGLGDFSGHLPRQLSGGMRMRASLARALVLEPRIFLFDEPFGALDEMTREKLNDEILALHRSRPFTGLFVTHSIAEAVYLSTRVVVMSARPGRIVADIPVPLPVDRSHDIRYSRAFGDVCAQVSTALRGGSR